MKKVMVRAWEIARAAVVKFGGKVKEFFAEALKMAWEEVKSVDADNIAIKSWFLTKNFTDGERYAISTSDLVIERETEKAVFIKAKSDFGVIKFWCPKSCLINCEKQEEIVNNKFKKYDALISWCKANNIKGVRSRMKVETVKAKIEACGLEMPLF